uniref:DUF834 domain-containing protein n=2 Tax=Oryza sativa subsp. japonica TaxID=39947 RepID=Q75L57_ORYSJ|nr:hypothetical protein [Oryza sativa Japonica Group]ABF97223.1 hypothetical protein LOC_Os03g37680 [Oryza sativa Japonica Group]
MACVFAEVAAGLLLTAAMPTVDTARSGDHGVDDGWLLEAWQRPKASGSRRRADSGEIRRKGTGGRGSSHPCEAEGGDGAVSFTYAMFATKSSGNYLSWCSSWAQLYLGRCPKEMKNVVIWVVIAPSFKVSVNDQIWQCHGPDSKLGSKLIWRDFVREGRVRIGYKQHRLSHESATGSIGCRISASTKSDGVKPMLPDSKKAVPHLSIGLVKALHSHCHARIGVLKKDNCIY